MDRGGDFIDVLPAGATRSDRNQLYLLVGDCDGFGKPHCEILLMEARKVKRFGNLGGEFERAPDLGFLLQVNTLSLGFIQATFQFKQIQK